MSPEELTDQLKAIYKDNLKSVVLFGSAAAGDHAGKRSDFNVLCRLIERTVFSGFNTYWLRAGVPTSHLRSMACSKRVLSHKTTAYTC